jgi:hypothetical protein
MQRRKPKPAKQEPKKKKPEGLKKQEKHEREKEEKREKREKAELKREKHENAKALAALRNAITQAQGKKYNVTYVLKIIEGRNVKHQTFHKTGTDAFKMVKSIAGAIKNMRDNYGIDDVELKRFIVNNIQRPVNPDTTYLYGAKFIIHRDGIDQNFEIPDGCVPNGLFKLYGSPSEQKRDRTKSTRLKSMEDVLEILGGSLTQGYRMEDIYKFADEIGIRSVILVDQHMKREHTHINTGKIVKDLPVLVCMAQFNHLYLVTGKEQRNKIMKIKGLKKVEKKTFNPDKYKFFTTAGIVDKKWRELASVDEFCLQNYVKYQDKVIQFKWMDKIYREWTDMKSVILQARTEGIQLTKPMSIHRLAAQVAEPYLKPSIIKEDIWSNDTGRHVLNDGFLSPLADQKIYEVDINKCYTSCFWDNKYGWPIYTPFDGIQLWDGKIDVGYYRFENCPHELAYKGNGWYIAEIAIRLVQEGYEPVRMLRATEYAEPQHFQELITKLSKWEKSRKWPYRYLEQTPRTYT